MKDKDKLLKNHQEVIKALVEATSANSFFEEIEKVKPEEKEDFFVAFLYEQECFQQMLKSPDFQDSATRADNTWIIGEEVINKNPFMEWQSNGNLRRVK